MVLLGDESQVEARFSPFEDSANLEQDRCTVCAERTIALENCFGRIRWNTKVTWVMSNLVLVHLKIVLVSVQDRCTVCAKYTVGSEIILDAANNTPR
jgi:hypothetical protein